METTVTYQSTNQLLRDNGEIVEFGDDILVNLNQDANPALPVSIVGTLVPPFNGEGETWDYTIKYDTNQTNGITLVDCHILNVNYFSCCQREQRRLDNLIAFLNVTENPDGTFSQ